MYFLAQLVRITLIGLIVVAPWFFGAVWAQVQWWIMLAVALLLAVELVTRFGDDDRPNLIPAAWLPVLGGLILGLVQLVNWPGGLAETMAPRTIQLRAELTTDDGKSPLAISEMGQAIGVTQRTRSVYPLATREYSALLAVAMAVFVLASIHLINKQSVQWTFVAVAVCGTALSFFGLIQRLSWNGKFYWVIEPLSGGFQSFGPFVNRNNAGGFLNLCLAASVGLLVWLHWKPEMDLVHDESDATKRRSTRRSRGGRSRASRSERNAPTISPVSNSKFESDSVEEQPEPTTLEGEAHRVPPSEDETKTEPTTGVAPDAAVPDNVRPDTASSDTASPESEPPQAASAAPQEPASFEDQLRAAYEASRSEGIDPTSTDLPTPPATGSADHDSKAVTPESRSSSKRSHRSERGERSSRRGRSSSASRGARSGSSSFPDSASAKDTTGKRPSRSQSTRFGDAAYPGAYDNSGGKNGTPWQSVSSVVSNYFAELNAPRVWALLLVGFSAGGVLSSASRGSILAMFAATMVTIMALMFRRGQRGYAAGLLLMLVAGLGVMSWAGQTEFVQQRFELMFEQNSLEQGRLPNWLEATRAVPQFPWLGSGLGTYRWVYERYQERFLDRTIHTHAENQFLQTLVEAGFVGLAFLIAEIVLVALAIIRLFRAGGQVNSSLALMGTFALTSQVFGGCFDFGLYIPSNTMLMAALCGMVIGRAALLSIWPNEAMDAIDAPAGGITANMIAEDYSDESMATPEPSNEIGSDSIISSVTHASRAKRAAHRRIDRHVLLGLAAPPALATFVIGFLLLGCLFGSLELNKASKIEAATRPIQLQRLGSSADIAAIDAALKPLGQVLPQRWDDAIAHQELARLLMQRYQATVYAQLFSQKNAATTAVDANPAETDTPPPRDADLWTRAAVVHLHASIRKLQRAGRAKAASDLIGSETVRQYLVPARRHLLLSRQIAPTIPETHFLLAELSAISNDQESQHLKRAQLLSPGNATIWYWSGLIDLNSGREDDACTAWNTCLALTPRYLDDIVPNTYGRLSLRRLLFDILPMQADLILATARKHFSQPPRLRFRPAFVNQAEAALPKTELPAAEHAYTTAWIYWLQGRVDEAQPQFALAISRNSTNLNWRREYVQLLLEMKDYKLAHEHATYLVRAKPKNKGYERLLRKVNSLRLRQVD